MHECPDCGWVPPFPVDEGEWTDILEVHRIVKLNDALDE